MRSIERQISSVLARATFGRRTAMAFVTAPSSDIAAAGDCWMTLFIEERNGGENIRVPP
jgi:hypothetical protein